MSANANQLRTALEYPIPYKGVIVGMISLSLILQIVASLMLVIERMTCKKKEFARCHKYNIAISIIVVFIIFCNIFITAFGVPDPNHNHNNNNNIVSPAVNNALKEAKVLSPESVFSVTSMEE